MQSRAQWRKKRGKAAVDGSGTLHSPRTMATRVHRHRLRTAGNDCGGKNFAPTKRRLSATGMRTSTISGGPVLRAEGLQRGRKEAARRHSGRRQPKIRGCSVAHLAFCSVARGAHRSTSRLSPTSAAAALLFPPGERNLFSELIYRLVSPVAQSPLGVGNATHSACAVRATGVSSAAPSLHRAAE